MRKPIAKIEAALKRLDEATYGYCEDTGEPIGVRRLEARPIATHSVEAQERHESNERLYSEDRLLLFRTAPKRRTAASSGVGQIFPEHGQPDAEKASCPG